MTSRASTVLGLDLKIRQLRAEITRLAAQGDITACDILHGEIGTLESAISIMLAGE